MIRSRIAAKSPTTIDGFRMRGAAVSRIEAFSDAVFGFALTLLVVSLTPPKTYFEMTEALRGLIPFALCFSLLYGVWARHFAFFRRYGLEDNVVLILNGVLLLVVLGYVYPLKFLMLLVVNVVFGANSDAASVFQQPGVPVTQQSVQSQTAHLFITYGGGYAAVMIVFVLLYGYAYLKRESLHLTEGEQLDTRWFIIGHALHLIIPVVSILIASLAPASWVPWAGWVYFGAALASWYHGSAHGAARREFRKNSHAPQVVEGEVPERRRRRHRTKPTE